MCALFNWGWIATPAEIGFVVISTFFGMLTAEAEPARSSCRWLWLALLCVALALGIAEVASKVAAC